MPEDITTCWLFMTLQLTNVRYMYIVQTQTHNTIATHSYKSNACAVSEILGYQIDRLWYIIYTL